MTYDPRALMQLVLVHHHTVSALRRLLAQHHLATLASRRVTVVRAPIAAVAEVACRAPTGPASGRRIVDARRVDVRMVASASFGQECVVGIWKPFKITVLITVIFLFRKVCF